MAFQHSVVICFVESSSSAGTRLTITFEKVCWAIAFTNQLDILPIFCFAGFLQSPSGNR